MPVGTPRRVAIVGLRADHLRFLDDEAARLAVPRSRLIEGLLDYMVDLLTGGRLVIDSGHIVDPGHPNHVARMLTKTSNAAAQRPMPKDERLVGEG